MTIREPEWTEQDLAEAIALLKVEADTCNGCGEPLSETTDPEAEGGYDVDAPTRCHACTELARARAVERPHPEALYFEVRRTWKPET